jgi:hypothetical protein
MIKVIHYGIKAKVNRDKESDTWTIYSKQFNISSHGRTMKQAKMMFQSQITDILTTNTNNLNK